MSIESVLPSSHLILCCPLLLLTSIFPSIRVFSNESAFLIRWPKYWNFSISPSNEYSGLISFRIDWFDFLAVKGFSRVFSNSQSGQLLSHVWLFATPWTAAHQAPLSSTISQNLLKFLSIESVMLSNHLILCHPFFSFPQSLPASGSFPMSWLFTLIGQSIGTSASALPMNI